MTNREKAIADFTKYLDTLNAEELAEVLNVSCPIDACCKYCVYNSAVLRFVEQELIPAIMV